MKPTAARVREYLDYNPKTGDFTWIKSSGYNKSQFLRKPAGSVTSAGYIVIKIFGKIYGAHRLAWLLMTGDWPSAHLDHRNGVRTDNQWVNLRIGGYNGNAQNRPPRKNTKTGLKGVVVVDDRYRRKPYAAKIGANGKTYYLGYFATPEEAHAAYCKAAKKYHREYARPQ